MTANSTAPLRSTIPARLDGEMVGALVFGRTSDRVGRKRPLIMTLTSVADMGNTSTEGGDGSD